MAKLRVAGISASGPTSTPVLRLRVAGIVVSGASNLTVAPIDAVTVEPLRTVTVNASVPAGSAASFAWRQISGQAVTLTGSGAARSFATPATFNGTEIVLGVTASNGGVQSAEVRATVNVRPQITWRRVHGGDWHPGWLFSKTLRAGTPGPTPTRPLKIALIGDSTLAGIGVARMRTALAARGWRPENVWFYARSGKPIILDDDLGKNALVNMAEARAELGEPDVWVFNLGSNGHRDARNPQWINSVLDNAGQGRVIWSGITQANGNADTATRLAWNALAKPLVEARGQFLDWHGYAKSFLGGDSAWWNADGVHHTEIGTTRKTEFLASSIGSA